jgi:hypothetical protein
MRVRRALQWLVLVLVVLKHANLIVRCQSPITTVGNFSALRAAIAYGEQHIEIIQHLDLTALKVTEGKSSDSSVTSKFLSQPRKSTVDSSMLRSSISFCCTWMAELLHRHLPASHMHCKRSIGFSSTGLRLEMLRAVNVCQCRCMTT